MEQQRLLFEQWYRVRDGTLSRTEFAACVQPIQQQIHQLLSIGVSYEIAPKEKTPLAKTVRTCQQLLKVEPPTRLEVTSRRHAGASPAFWTFVTTEGIEPTNNAAERALRESGLVA